MISTLVLKCRAVTRYVVSPIVVRDGRERFANPRFNEVYGYEFPTEDKAIEVLLQSRDIVLLEP